MIIKKNTYVKWKEFLAPMNDRWAEKGWVGTTIEHPALTDLL
jgi:hypothetical protein